MYNSELFTENSKRSFGKYIMEFVTLQVVSWEAGPDDCRGAFTSGPGGGQLPHQGE